MSAFSDFIIPVVGLKLGEHSYQFEVDRQFFKEFNNAELEQGRVHVDLTLIKRSNLIELVFLLKGKLKSFCDRCGGELYLPIDCKEMRIVKFSEQDYDIADDVLILRPNEHQLNVSHIVYEALVLGMPISKSHNKELNGQICDSEVLDKLKEYQEKDVTNDIDDRWLALKKLLTDK